MIQSEGRGTHYRELAAICREKGDEVAATWEPLAVVEEQIARQAVRAEEEGPRASASRQVF